MTIGISVITLKFRFDNNSRDNKKRSRMIRKLPVVKCDGFDNTIKFAYILPFSSRRDELKNNKFLHNFSVLGLKKNDFGAKLQKHF